VCGQPSLGKAGLGEVTRHGTEHVVTPGRVRSGASSSRAVGGHGRRRGCGSCRRLSGRRGGRGTATPAVVARRDLRRARRQLRRCVARNGRAGMVRSTAARNCRPRLSRWSSYHPAASPSSAAASAWMVTARVTRWSADRRCGPRHCPSSHLKRDPAESAGRDVQARRPMRSRPRRRRGVPRRGWR